MNRPNIVNRTEWLIARRALLEREKAFTRERDALAAERRLLPMVRIDKDYALESAQGRFALRDLFDARRQLIVYHFMFLPEWDEGCPSCSHFADNFDGWLTHLAARDTSFAVVSRAPSAKLEAFKRRMGWGFRYSFAEAMRSSTRTRRMRAGSTA